MINDSFQVEFNVLIEKYSDLLIGKSSPEMIEKIKIMAIYSYLSKAMPPLLNHWNQMHPDSRDVIKNIFAEIKQLNEEHKK